MQTSTKPLTLKLDLGDECNALLREIASESKDSAASIISSICTKSRLESYKKKHCAQKLHTADEVFGKNWLDDKNENLKAKVIAENAQDWE